MPAEIAAAASLVAPWAAKLARAWADGLGLEAVQLLEARWREEDRRRRRRVSYLTRLLRRRKTPAPLAQTGT